MFPGYIFARFQPAQARDILKAAGVVSIVGFGAGYCPVNESEIEAIRILLRSGVEVVRESLLRPGTKVCIRHGALQGLEGRLVEVKNRRRLLISVELLQRAVAVDIENVMVEPLGTRGTAA